MGDADDGCHIEYRNRDSCKDVWSLRTYSKKTQTKTWSLWTQCVLRRLIKDEAGQGLMYML